MAVTIGTVNSTLNVTDSGTQISAAVLEQIVQQVLIRLKEQTANDTQMREEQEISDRATSST